MRHNSHGPMDGPDPPAGAGARARDPAAGRGGDPGGDPAAGRGGDPGGDPAAGRGGDPDGDPAAGRGGRRAPGDGAAGGPRPAGSSTSPEEILGEAARHLRQRAGGIGAAGGPRGGAPEAERILGATDPHGILGIPRGATIAQAKSRYKSLVKRYDAARGIINKSAPEREKSNLIMAKINGAFEAFKSSRAPPP